MDLKLNGKRALVTGSTAGIGLAIASGLAREGAHVIVNGRTQNRIDSAIASILEEQNDASVSGIAADFSEPNQVKDLCEKAGEVNILINNIGIFEPRDFVDITDEEWYKMFEVNVMSGIRMSRHFFPKMIRDNWGRIVFISSESGVQIPNEMIHYGMSKTSQIAVAGGLARLTIGTGVTVNTVLPGSTMSEGAAAFVNRLAKEEGKSPEEFEKDFFSTMRPSCLLQRFASTDEVANMVVYLASPLSSATNGAALRVDGGTIPTIL